MAKRLLFAAAVFAALIFVLYAALVPDTSALKKTNPKKTSLMEFREAEWRKAGKKRHPVQQWVSINSISPYLVKAVIIAEDDKFYEHEGFDIEGMKEAMEKNIKAGKLKAGGSTITQQLAKNLYLTPERSVLRKLREAAIAWSMERSLSKRRILELYLNVAEWGDGIYGAEAAARHYYGKPASDLTAMEAARLASVLPSPRRYDPLSDQGFVARRAEFILDIMVRRGIVIQEFEEVTAPSADAPLDQPTTVDASKEPPPAEAPPGQSQPEPAAK